LFSGLTLYYDLYQYNVEHLGYIETERTTSYASNIACLSNFMLIQCRAVPFKNT